MTMCSRDAATNEKRTSAGKPGCALCPYPLLNWEPEQSIVWTVRMLSDARPRSNATCTQASRSGLSSRGKTHILLHSGTTMRFHTMAASDQYRFIIIVDATGKDAGLSGFLSPHWLSVRLTHSKGRSWPAAQGEALAKAILARGGVVALCFRARIDACTCQQRLAEQQP